jgi:hypothetical protein
MPVSYQIVPQGSVLRPKIETHINDNTEVTETYESGGGETSAAIFVFASPKGRDNKLITIRNGIAEFMEEYGLGPFSVYGQPLLNAYRAVSAASSAQSLLHCMRVTPADAAYSTATLIAKYKVVGTTTKELSIKYVVKPSDSPLTDLSNLSTCCTVSDEEDEDGYTAVKLFTVAYQGRGSYGRNIRFRITTDRISDKENDYKNYIFAVYRYETILSQKESFSLSFVEDAVYSGASIYADDVINDEESGSDIIKIVSFPAGFLALYNAYKVARPSTSFTVNDFDPLLGIDKYTRTAIPGLTIEAAESVEPATGETAVEMSSSSGVSLLGGSDGSIAATEDPVSRQTALNALYLKAFKGELDPNIQSKNRYPTTFIYDANYPKDVKLAIVSLVTKRGDCIGTLDFGTGIKTVASIKSYYESNFAGLIDSNRITLEPYAMKIRDPYSQKTVEVTSTYWLAGEYSTHIFNWGGKHRPLAGNRFGIISGYIGNSIYPVIDDELDTSIADELAELRLNYAKYNQNQVVVRAMQNTSQSKLSVLTEESNMLVVLDVKRDAERLAAQIEYDFAEPTDLARFNIALKSLVDKYSAAQVRSISASFSKNSWEAERSIIHLTIEMVNRDLVKTTIIEIDVNRSDS